MLKKERTNFKKIFWMLFSVALSVLTVWAILRESRSLSLPKLYTIVAGGNKLYLIISVLCAAGFVVFEAVAICSILRGIGYKTKPFDGLLYSTSDVYFSAITPSATGGQPASAYFMHEDKIPTGVVSATLILNLMMYTAAIGFLGIIAIILNPVFFKEFDRIPRILIMLGFVALIGLIAVFFTLLKDSDKLFTLIKRIVVFFQNKNIGHNWERSLEKLEKVHKDYKNCATTFAGRNDILIKAFIWNVLQRASQIAIPMFMHLCLGGLRKDAVTLFSKQCLITIGYNFVPIPGAMGIADYLMIDGFSKIMTHETALLLDMVSRAVSFYICVTISGLITLGGYLWKKRKR